MLYDRIKRSGMGGTFIANEAVLVVKTDRSQLKS